MKAHFGFILPALFVPCLAAAQPRSVAGAYEGALQKRRIRASGGATCRDVAQIGLQLSVTQRRRHVQAVLTTQEGAIPGEASLTETGLNTVFEYTDAARYERTVTIILRRITRRAAEVRYNERVQWPAGGGCTFIFAARVPRDTAG